MPKGSLIAQLKVTDTDQYAVYGAAATKLLEHYGGRALVRPDTALVVEGNPRPRTIIFEFDSIARAKAFWGSEEYVQAKALRANAAEADFILIECVE
ncbi:DUF1330 domain-containing protein [Rhizobium leucaenae]|uniref:DUF1330 domain-containing protein n=1 Tax=Rhizobium leucaenae TaxID=29450 RepID=UPI0007EE70A8|nr:DUF1330 domain-containing protein [Rhizobium leucaenae]MBB6304765.1 uncharacterized protein (DUF1330 family) [Rhizobium leucaenae]